MDSTVRLQTSGSHPVLLLEPPSSQIKSAVPSCMGMKLSPTKENQTQKYVALAKDPLFGYITNTALLN